MARCIRRLTEVIGPSHPMPISDGTAHRDDPELEYFSDGITEDIITDLPKISG